MARSRILVLNAGSSSLKFAAMAGSAARLEVLASGQVAGLGNAPVFSAEIAGRSSRETLAPGLSQDGALHHVLAALARGGLPLASMHCVGHRIVHGGAAATRPMAVTAETLAALDGLRALAPLHNGFGLGGIHAIRALDPAKLQVACFDTAFHATQPAIHTRLPLPANLRDEGYRRYGFHGLNYEHVVDQLPLVSGLPLPARLLIFHLGNGCSICAVAEGRSVATTMGYSTLDGLVMGTRAGAIDPGVIIALVRDKAMDADAIEHLLYRQSGLLGLSGLSGDMRTLVQSSAPEAAEAVAQFQMAAARQAASLAPALGGIDALVFTGGIGTFSPVVRAGIIAHLQWLGFALDARANADNAAQIAALTASKPIWIVPADEERRIATHCLPFLEMR